MKIGIEASRATISGRGIERYTNNLLRGLGQVDRENEYVLISADRGLSERLGLPSHFKVENPKKRFRMIHREGAGWIGRFLFRDLDGFHFPNADIWHSKYQKTAVTLHDLAPLHYPEHFFRDERERRTYDQGLGFIKKNADAIITVSEYSKRDMIDRLEVDPDKIWVVPNGVDEGFRKAQLGDGDWQTLKNKFGIDGPFVFFLGGTDFRKNAERVVRAFIDAAEAGGIPHQLVITGDQTAPVRNQQTPLQALTGAGKVTERVLFVGRVDDRDLRILYNAADLFVFPSLFEGFGLPVLEAMACGCPTLISTSASLPEIAGGASMAVDPLDVKAMKNEMVRILTSPDLKTELRAKGMEQARKFSWQKAASQTRDIYLKVFKH